MSWSSRSRRDALRARSRSADRRRHFQCSPPSTSISQKHLERIAADPRIKRHPPPSAVRSRRPVGWRKLPRHFRRLAPLGLTFDICVRSDQLGVARALAAACPDVQFVLDHCGNPPIASGDIAQWRTDIAALATLLQRGRKDFRHRQSRPARLEMPTTCAPWSNIWSRASAGPASSGAPTALCSRSMAPSPNGSRPPNPSLPTQAPTSRQNLHRNAERIYRLGSA